MDITTLHQWQSVDLIKWIFWKSTLERSNGESNGESSLVEERNSSQGFITSNLS